MESKYAEKQLTNRELWPSIVKFYEHSFVYVTFWTGLERFNSTHFIARLANGENSYFMLSKHFERLDLKFMSSVLHHVPRYNVESCPKVEKIYREGTDLTATLDLIAAYNVLNIGNLG